MPDAHYDAILGVEGAQKKFVRSWDLSSQNVGLKSGIAQLRAEATISLRFVNEEKWGFEGEMNLTWNADGTVGHHHPVSDTMEGGPLDLELVEDGWF